MTPRDTIIKMILNYPLIAKTNGEIQSHLFLTIGNGYDWENGELINKFKEDNEASSIKTAVNKLLDYYMKEDNSWNALIQSKVTCLKSFLNFLKEQINTINDYPIILAEPLEKYFNNVPDKTILYIDKYSKIYELPDKITLDWYNAITNFLLHLEPYINDNKEQKEIIKEIKDKLRNIRVSIE